MSEEEKSASGAFVGETVARDPRDKRYNYEPRWVCLLLQDATGRKMTCSQRSFGGFITGSDCRECNYVLLFPDSARMLLGSKAAPPPEPERTLLIPHGSALSLTPAPAPGA